MIVAVLNEDVPQMLARGWRDLGQSKASSFRLMAWVEFDTAPKVDSESAHIKQAVAALEEA